MDPKQQTTKRQEEPIKISSMQMECHQDQNFCKAMGKPHVEKGMAPHLEHLYADSMIVYFEPKKDQEKKSLSTSDNQQSKIQSIQVDKNVVYISLEYKIQCDKATYQAANQKIFLEGSVKVLHKGHFVSGEKGWIDLAHKKYYIENQQKFVRLLINHNDSTIKSK